MNIEYPMAKPARARVPICPTYQIYTTATALPIKKAMVFEAASCMKVGAIFPPADVPYSGATEELDGLLVYAPDRR